MPEEEGESHEEEEKTPLENILTMSVKSFFVLMAGIGLVLSLFIKSPVLEWLIGIGVIGFAIFMVLDSWE